jgi:hypothetical protein
MAGLSSVELTLDVKKRSHSASLSIKLIKSIINFEDYRGHGGLCRIAFSEPVLSISQPVVRFGKPGKPTKNNQNQEKRKISVSESQ